MAKAKVIAIGNHKGGVAKTTTTANLGAALVKSGKKVLLVDLDPQASLSTLFQKEISENNIYKAIKFECEAVPYEVRDNLFLIPSTLDLIGAESELADMLGRDTLVKDILKPFISKFDYILIDTPPALSLLTINGLVAADDMIITFLPEPLVLAGMVKILNTIDKIKSRLNPNLEILGLLPTLYKNVNVHADILDAIEFKYPGLLFKSRIRNSISLVNAQGDNQTIFEYDKDSNGAKDYYSFASEFIEKETQTGKPKGRKKKAIN